MTDRQLEVLSGLFVSRPRWVTPMMIGGGDQSHHAQTLRQLVAKGFVERKKLHAIYCYNGSTHRKTIVGNRWVVTDGHPPSTACCCKGSCRYRITARGTRALKKKGVR